MSSTIYHLEMTSRADFRSSKIPVGLEMRKVCDPEINSRFYREVGKKWLWTERLAWTNDEWSRWVGCEVLHTLVAYFEGEEAGYAELEMQEGGSVEIVYFGLLPGMIGKGLGGGTLSMAVERAWRIEGTKMVWLHTCTEDHPHAASNYEKRGFRLFHTETL